MDWWNDLSDWISSDNGWRVISGAIIPFVAIVVAGIVAALIGRSATKRVVAMQEREARNAAVAGVVSAARKAATWGSLGHDERAYADHLAEDADIRLRLLPVAGAPLAANWTQHEIADIKKNSSTFSFQAEQSLAEFRDRLLEWQGRPNRARKLFKSDLERWKFDSPDPDAELISRQQDWNADKASSNRESDAAPTAAPVTPAGVPTGPGRDVPTVERPTPTTTSLRPSAQRPTSAPVAAPTRPAGAGFSVTRAGGAAADPNATTPISDTSSANPTTPISDGNTTRAYGDGAGAPSRPPLGSPVSPFRPAGAGTGTGMLGGARTSDSDNADAVDDAGAAGSRPTSPRSGNEGGGDSTRTPHTDPGAPVPPPVAKPTSADAHVNRAPGSDARTADTTATPHTRSIPTRITDGPAEPADANETSEAPYTQPISASELRRRAADDDE